MKVVLSIGCGRLHLVTSAIWLAKADVALKLICGWVPRRANGMLVRLCSAIIGRDLSVGMAKRVINDPHITVLSMPVADFFDQGLRLANRFLFRGRYTSFVASLGWRVFGLMSCRYLKDAQVFHCRSGAGRFAIAVAKRRGMKVVVDHSIAHPAFMERQLRAEYEKNGEVFDLGMDSSFWQQVVKDCEEVDIVQVNSFFVRDTFIEAGFDPKKIRVVYLGEREDFFGLRKPKFEPCRDGEDGERKPLRLLFTGGFGFRKGGEYILEACKILKERGVPFIMDIVGDYSSAKNLIKRYESFLDIHYGSTNSYPLTPNSFSITFHGPKPQDELKTFLANGDIYVFPSLAEGCAQSGMEAMSAGMCVVGTKECGFPIVDGDNGYLVPSKDAHAIADRIQWLDTHRAEIERIGANAAKLIAENYTWSKYAENTIKVYEELLHG